MRNFKQAPIWLAIVSVGMFAGCSEQKDATPVEHKTETHAQAQTSSAVQTPTMNHATQQSAADVKQSSVTQTISASEVKRETQSEAKTVATASTGASLYARCVGCHGASGEGGVGPKLKGQSKEALMSKIKGYRDGKQFGPMTSMMAPNVQGMSDAEIEKVAEYIAKL